MPRKKTSWTPTYGKWKTEAMERAMQAVKNEKLGLRQAAKQYGVPQATLCRRLRKGVSAVEPATRPPIFTAEDEQLLVQYVQEMEALGFGLSISAVRKLAYEMAEDAGINHRFNKEEKKAGYDWYQGFMRRHPELSLRKPEGLSAARAAMLNPKVIGDHFTKLGEVLDTTGLKSKPAQIYNLDETGLSLVHTPSKVISTKGKKTVQSRTSGDRGENVTVLVCANAQGTVLPPFIIFKGKRLSPALTQSAPPGTLFGVSDSSFINAELFETWIKRMFIPSLPPSRPVLLILDGHYSHITISTLKLARENSIHIYCLPPHTTNHTQPLDKSVFRSVKSSYNQRCERFMRENPQRLITRYDFCGIFRDVFHSALSMANIVSGFKSTGIYPFNPLAITTEHMQFSSVETELEFAEPVQGEVASAASNSSITTIPVVLNAGSTVIDLPTVDAPASVPASEDDVPMEIDTDTPSQFPLVVDFKVHNTYIHVPIGLNVKKLKLKISNKLA
ncbi:jerky protein homolog-like isoform X2 [Acanthaster planci]|nr:jerky protein homolog-like isoform X2 [Acanthaster planci]